MVCVAPGLGDSVREMGRTARDQVVMVRIDEKTSQALDEWVATGAVKSRSEAAALFIREGLKVRADELDRLRDALREVDEARERLQRRAKEVFGPGGEKAGDSN
jgi:Arc/MetJ-type ribon-helix-helix transcriptional regulator